MKGQYFFFPFDISDNDEMKKSEEMVQNWVENGQNRNQEADENWKTDQNIKTLPFQVEVVDFFFHLESFSY